MTARGDGAADRDAYRFAVGRTSLSGFESDRVLFLAMLNLDHSGSGVPPVDDGKVVPLFTVRPRHANCDLRVAFKYPFSQSDYSVCEYGLQGEVPGYEGQIWADQSVESTAVPVSLSSSELLLSPRPQVKVPIQKKKKNSNTHLGDAARLPGNTTMWGCSFTSPETLI